MTKKKFQWTFQMKILRDNLNIIDMVNCLQYTMITISWITIKITEITEMIL